MPVNLDIQAELTKAVVGVVRHKEFYGHVVSQFEKRVVRNPHHIDTACVGRSPGDKFIKFYLNADYFSSLYEEEFSQAGVSQEGQRNALKKARGYTSGAVEHEVIHVIMDHLFREFDDKMRGNMAMDLVVNQMLSIERRHPSWVMPDRYKLPPSRTAQWYYDNLKDNGQYLKDVSSGAFGMGGILSWVNSGHSMWGDVAKDSVVREFVRDVIRKAVENTSSEGWGEVPGGIRELIDNLLQNRKPKVPWGKVFRCFCASAAENLLSYTMSRESRRFGTRPGTRKQDMLKIAVIVDTSGSVSAEKLAMFFNEVRWIWRNGAEVTVFEADCAVERSYEFKGKFDGKVFGRGGTNLEPALEAAEAGKFDVAVYLTDFYAPKILRRYRLPVLWVLSDPPEKSQWPCHWGRMVTIGAA